jgi:hypothetical protein
MSDILAEIDGALARRDLKRAETLIARQLRRTNNPVERAELLFRRSQSRLMDAKPEDALEDLQTGLALQPDRRNDADIGVLIGDTYFARALVRELNVRQLKEHHKKIRSTTKSDCAQADESVGDLHRGRHVQLAGDANEAHRGGRCFGAEV